MSESLHEYVVYQLQMHKGRWPEVAKASDVPYKTLQKIADGTTKNPGVHHVDKLSRYFRERVAN